MSDLLARHEALAHRFVERLSAGDVEGVAELYHDDMRGWRNVDGRELVKKQMLKVVAFLSGQVRELRYEELRIKPLPSGWVQQHVLRAVSPSGTAVEVAACLVVTVEDGTIRRIDEYMDSVALAPLLG